MLLCLYEFAKYNNLKSLQVTSWNLVVNPHRQYPFITELSIIRFGASCDSCVMSKWFPNLQKFKIFTHYEVLDFSQLRITHLDVNCDNITIPQSLINLNLSIRSTNSSAVLLRELETASLDLLFLNLNNQNPYGTEYGELPAILDFVLCSKYMVCVQFGNYKLSLSNYKLSGDIISYDGSIFKTDVAIGRLFVKMSSENSLLAQIKSALKAASG